MQTESSIDIDRPIDEVFDYTTQNVAEWSLVVVEDRIVDEKPGGVGTTFHMVTEEGGRRMEFDGVVTRHEPPTAHAVLMKGKQFDIEGEYLFEDLGGRTRVTQRSTVTGKGLVKVMLLLSGWLMRRAGCNALEKELVNLKRLCEARTDRARAPRSEAAS
jgi:hypothetical protein